MEMQDEPNPATSYSYMDFEPYCAWHKEEGSDILAVHLHGFKREQLRVQVNSKRTLTIHGQRPLDETKWRRFMKQIKLPDNCMEDGIRAKFAAGILTIIMPKRLSSYHHQEASTCSISRDQPKVVLEEAKTKSNIVNHKKKKVLGGLKIAGRVAVVVLVLGLSGAYVNCICKHRSCAQN